MLGGRTLTLKGYLFFGAMLVIIIAGVVFFFTHSSQNTTGNVQPQTTLPTAGSNTQINTSTSVSNPVGAFIATSTAPTQMTLQGRDGGAIVTQDFLHDGVTVADAVNEGSYMLAGSLGYCTADGVCGAHATTTDFSITYDVGTQFFNIILLAEPVGPVRTEAEQYLLSRLGIPASRACALNYYVGTPYWVSETYAGKNLGFSFCHGATPLPQ